MSEQNEEKIDAFAELSAEQSGEQAHPVVAGEGKAIVKKRGKKKVLRHVSNGCVHIQATYNNTIITFTDAHGNVLAQSSAGRLGFKGPKKSTPYAASLIVRDAFEKAKRYGLEEVAVYVRGIGSGREGALRALHTTGLAVSALKDVTPIPHNGCRPKKVRRV
ncbi:30S ribosomal protein S11 [Candidatus Uhrbacteria bacterium]|nr:30S ribosomal protein S11 [Candidatus Uhrbacteria bacterium]